MFGQVQNCVVSADFGELLSLEGSPVNNADSGSYFVFRMKPPQTHFPLLQVHLGHQEAKEAGIL